MQNYLKIYFIFYILFLAINAHATNATSATNIVVLGDSLAAGYQLPKHAGFVEKLQTKLNLANYNTNIINAAVPGDTTKGGLARLDWALGDNTHAVILELGANDALRALPPPTTYDNLNQIILTLKKRGIKILLAGMLAPPNLGDEYTQQFNAIYPKLAQQHDILFLPFFLEGVAANPAFNLNDGIHPNEQGVEIIVNNIFPLVEKLLKKL